MTAKQDSIEKDSLYGTWRDEKGEGYSFIGHAYESFIMTRSASGFEPIDGKFEARTDVVISYHLIEASKLHDW